LDCRSGDHNDHRVCSPTNFRAWAAELAFGVDIPLTFWATPVQVVGCLIVTHCAATALDPLRPPMFRAGRPPAGRDPDARCPGFGVAATVIRSADPSISRGGRAGRIVVRFRLDVSVRPRVWCWGARSMVSCSRRRSPPRTMRRSPKPWNTWPRVPSTRGCTTHEREARRDEAAVPGDQHGVAPSQHARWTIRRRRRWVTSGSSGRFEHGVQHPDRIRPTARVVACPVVRLASNQDSNSSASPWLTRRIGTPPILTSVPWGWRHLFRSAPVEVAITGGLHTRRLAGAADASRCGGDRPVSGDGKSQ
jgi:hypothetical protein